MAETAGHLSDANTQEPALVPPVTQGQYRCSLQCDFWVWRSNWLASASILESLSWLILAFRRMQTDAGRTNFFGFH
jgi:hypothetical protein